MADACINIHVTQASPFDCEGDSVKCEGGYRYNCVDGTWVKSSTECECNADDTKCGDDGYTYVCDDMVWQKTTETCSEEEPECTTGATECRDGYKYSCQNGKWTKTSTTCGDVSDPVSACITIPFLPDLGCVKTTYVVGAGVLILAILMLGSR